MRHHFGRVLKRPTRTSRARALQQLPNRAIVLSSGANCVCCIPGWVQTETACRTPPSLRVPRIKSCRKKTLEHWSEPYSIARQPSVFESRAVALYQLHNSNVLSWLETSIEWTLMVPATCGLTSMTWLIHMIRIFSTRITLVSFRYLSLSKGSLLHSYLNASIGSSREALIAGSMPLTMPTNPRIRVEIIRLFGEMISRMSPASAFLATAL